MGKDGGGLLDRIVVVIKTQNSPGGSTLQALKKEFKDESVSGSLKTALKKGVESGELVQGKGQRWWVEGHEPPPPPPEETVDIVDVEVNAL